MKFLVPDHTGHSTEVFDKSSKVSMQDAMARFDELMKSGHVPAALGKDGKHTVNRTFDPTAEEVLFVPHLKGG
jgi:hypothetical protein